MATASTNAAVNAIARNNDKFDLAKRLFKTEKAAVLAKKEGIRVMANLSVAGTASVAAFGSGWLMAKYPEAAKLPVIDIDTELGIGAALTLAGVALAGRAGADGQAGGLALGLGMGLLMPWLNRKGADTALQA